MRMRLLFISNARNALSSEMGHPGSLLFLDE